MTDRLDYPLLVTWLLILALGTVMVTSTGIAVDASLLPRQAVYLALALMTFTAVALMPLRIWQATHRLSWLIAHLLPKTIPPVTSAGFSLTPALDGPSMGTLYISCTPTASCTAVYATRRASGLNAAPRTRPW